MSVLLGSVVGSGLRFKGFFSDRYGGHRLGPPAVKGQVSNCLDQLSLRDAVFSGSLQVEGQLLGITAGDERGHGNETAVTLRKFRALPYVAEEDVVSELHQFGRKVAEGFLDGRWFFVHVVCSLVFFWFLGCGRPVAVLLVADSFQPIDVLAVDLLLDRDVRHRRSRRGSVPVLHAGWDADDVALPHLLNGTSPTLNPTSACCHDQHLAEWMGVPGRACSGLEGD